MFYSAGQYTLQLLASFPSTCNEATLDSPGGRSFTLLFSVLFFSLTPFIKCIHRLSAAALLISKVLKT